MLPTFHYNSRFFSPPFKDEELGSEMPSVLFRTTQLLNIKAGFQPSVALLDFTAVLLVLIC
jgi:hypothetical protein